MAKELDSKKIFSGDGLPMSRSYFIAGAVITREPMHFAGLPNKFYDCLKLELLQDHNGKPGPMAMSPLHLNGCWREREGADGKTYKASGGFFELLLKQCVGFSFGETCNWINENLKGKRISISYTTYPRSKGGNGCVPNVEFM